jgi:hypothetical protein
VAGPLSTSETVTLFLAIWGAGLSTFSIARDSLRAKPRGKVWVRYELIPKSHPPEMGIHGVFVNVGREPIFLDRALLRAPEGRKGTWMEKYLVEGDLPKLNPGQSQAVHVKFRDVENMIDFLVDTPAEREEIDFRFRVIFVDQVGRQYSSRLMRLPYLRISPDGTIEVRTVKDRRLLIRFLHQIGAYNPWVHRLP